jgi:hypothetical protein
MATLTKEEILAELKEFGLCIPCELRLYLKEYKKYYSLYMKERNRHY